MSPARIWICGARGMLGQAQVRTLGTQGFTVLATDIDEVDLTREGDVLSFARQNHPDWIINAAAFTAVDRAETEFQAALAVNRDAPAHLARAAAEQGSTLVHISTDYVFSGSGSRPWRESDPVSPLSRYGQSKAAGEEAVMRINPRSLIFRISWLYGPDSPMNFPFKILQRAREGADLRVVNDQWGAPTYAPFLAQALRDLIRRPGSPPPGLYHWSDEGCISWFGFARAILEGARARGLLPHDVALTPQSSSELVNPAPRPANSRLDLTKVRTVLGLEARPWPEGLDAWLDQFDTPQEPPHVPAL